MLGLLRSREPAETENRLTLAGLAEQVKYLNNSYPLGLQGSINSGPVELPPMNYETFADIYAKSGPIFACILARMTLFSEARFQFQRMRGGRPAELWGSPKLNILEKPYLNGTTGDLLARAEQDVSLAGTWYLWRDPANPTTVRRLRPDWVSIVMASKMDVQDISKALDVEVIWYSYKPPNEKQVLLDPADVVQWSPIPDPTAHYRGMSWVTPALMDVVSDQEASNHRVKFFKNSATANFVVLPDKDMGKEEFKDFRDDFNEKYEGANNAFKTIFIGGGSDIRTLGMDFEKMDFRNIQGAGETRIASVAGVPPIVAGFAQGLEAATYSNYGQARRKFGDSFARPQWRSVSGALAKFVETPNHSRLWYDDRDIPALREDLKDESEIRTSDAATIKLLIDAGYEPDAAVQYVSTGNMAVLEGAHTGRVSVQLNPMDGSDGEPDESSPEPPAEEVNEDSEPET